MRTSKFTNEQIVQALRQAESGTPVVDICRKLGTSRTPQRVDQLPNDPRRLHRYLASLGAEREIRACYEASSVRYVLQHLTVAWGYACTIIAPSLIPAAQVTSGRQRRAMP